MRGIAGIHLDVDILALTRCQQDLLPPYQAFGLARARRQLQIDLGNLRPVPAAGVLQGETYLQVRVIPGLPADPVPVMAKVV